jgi:DtxR family Mn-dependent transcriptional regulator
MNMDSPTFNLLIFAFLVAFAVVLFWPGFGLVQAVRGRMRMTKRTRLEDALKYVYDCEINDIAVTTSRLAKALQIVSTRVSELATQMSRAGLVSQVDGRILLTEEGKRYAVHVIRAHRLWERYLADETGIEPKEWHTQAEKHEHLLSVEEANALSNRLGNPRFDPHGDPIPTADGEFLQEKLMNLTQLKVGECAYVSHMEDEPEEVYGQLVTLGIFLGMEFRLIDMSGEFYIVEAEGRKLKLTPEAAYNLSIKPIEMIEAERISSTHDSLADLQAGEIAKVVRISPACRGFERRRLMDLGILPDTSIKFHKYGLTGGLTAFYVRGTVLALRFEQARMISICDRKKVEV